MARKFLSSFSLAPLPSDPVNGINGEIYFNTTTSIVRIWYNSQWNDLGDGSGGGGDSFKTISTPSGSSPVADSSADTLNLTSSNGISITGNSTTDSIEFSTNATSLNTASTIISRDSDQAFDITGVDFDTVDTIASAVGRLSWDDGEGTLSLGLKGGNLNLEIGQEAVALCYNGTGSTISKGSVVYISGAQGQRPSITLANADTETTSSKTFGIVAENITNGSEGFVATFGVVPNLNTSAFTAGQALWLSSTAGQITNVRPTQPVHSVFIGYCLHANESSGRIFLNIQNGYEIEELHNVLINGLADNHVLSYDNSTSLWKNQTLVDAIKEIDGPASGIDSDLLDGQEGTYYLDWTNTTNKPSPIITLSGDLIGSVTLTDLTSVTLNAVVSDDSHNHTISTITNFTEEVQDIVGTMISSNNESGISVSYDDTNGKLDFDVNDPTITLSGDLNGSVTITNLGNATLNALLNSNTSISNNLSVGNKLYVGQGASNFDTTTGLLTNSIAVFRFDNDLNTSSYAQIAFQNADSTSSTDIIAYMDNGSDYEGWVGIGITGSTFDDDTYEITGPGDAYIFHETKSATPAIYNGNLVFATGSNGIENKIVFAAGGYASGNTQMAIIPDESVFIDIDTESTSALTGALTVSGGAGFTGAVSIEGLIRVKGLTYVGEGAADFETDAELTNAKLVAVVEGDPYAQVAIYNPSTTSSTDLIIYADNGVDSSGWIDVGITGSEFSQSEFGITGPNDGYIFFEAPATTTGKGNLVIATGENGSENKIIFAAGGFSSGKDQMSITPDQNVNIEINTPSTSPTTGAFTVVGGVGIQGDVNIQGSITFGGAGTTVETDNLSVVDPMVYVGSENSGDAVDLGLVGTYVTGGNTKYSGVVRDASDGVIKFFKDASTKPTSTVNFSEVGLSYASIQVGGVSSSGNILTSSGTQSSPSISNINDSDTGIFFPDINTISITTNSSEKIRINSSGNVGINTTSPSEKLHVDGNIKLTGQVLFDHGSNKTSSTTISVNTSTAIDSFSTSTYTSAEYFVQMKQGTLMTTSRFVVIWDGVDINIHEYAIVNGNSGAVNASISASESLGTITVSVTSSNASTTNVIVKSMIQYIVS
jgi:hypothetical protein